MAKPASLAICNRMPQTWAKTTRQTWRRQLTLPFVCDARLGRPATSEAWMEAHRDAGLIGTDALLVWAVFEAEPDAWAGWINRTLACHDLAPMDLSDAASTPYDGLSAATPELRRGPLVLVAAHDARESLPAALRSLQRQNWRGFGSRVIGDASGDGTAEVARTFARDDPRIRVIEMDRNGGAYVARHAGLAQARGMFTAPLEALRYDGYTQPFPAPRILEGGRRAADLGRFYRVLGGDFRDPESLSTRMAGGQGARYGAVENCRPLKLAAGLCMCAESRAALVADGIRVIVLGERAECDLLALHDPALLDAVPAHLPKIRAARVMLVVPEGVAPGNDASRAAQADGLFGGAPLWTGVGAAAIAGRVDAERIAPAPWTEVSR